MPPEKATLLLERILSSMIQPAPAVPAVALLDKGPPMATAASARANRGRTPFFFAVAVTLVVTGSAAMMPGAAEPAAEAAEIESEAERVVRLDDDVSAARDHLSHLDSLLEARRVDAEQIEWLRARIARGPESFRTPQAYRSMVARYQQRREAWNRTLPDYQVVAGAFRTLSGIHNAKLDSLDALSPPLPAGQPTAAEEAVQRTRVRAVTSAAW